MQVGQQLVAVVLVPGEVVPSAVVVAGEELDPRDFFPVPLAVVGGLVFVVGVGHLVVVHLALHVHVLGNDLELFLELTLLILS